MSARKYTTNIPVPQNATLDEITSVVEFLRGLGAATDPTSRRPVIKFEWETDQVGAFEHGYALCEAEDEVNTQLASYGWQETTKRWVRA